ncbi:MAG: hypothetical protein MHMPM18_001217 [Marteilia pararefringens]
MNPRIFEIVKFLVLLGPILESSVLNGIRGKEYNGLYSCTYYRWDYALINSYSYHLGKAAYHVDYFCCKCISIYRLIPEFKDDLMQYIRAGGEIDIEAMHCQKSLVNMSDEELVDRKDLIASQGQLTNQTYDGCPSLSADYDDYRQFYYSLYDCNSDGAMSIENIYGHWIIAQDPWTQEMRVTSPNPPKSGRRSEVLTNRVFSDDFRVSQYCNSDQKLETEVPVVVVPNHSFANGAHICNESLQLASDEPQFDPVILIGSNSLQPTIDESCEIALKKLRGDTSSNYQCIKGSKKVLLRAKQEYIMSILNVIVLDFSHSDLRALGSSIYFDPANPPQYGELCSSSGVNLSNNGNLDYAAIELLRNEGVYIVKEIKRGSEEFHFSTEIVLNTNFTGKLIIPCRVWPFYSAYKLQISYYWEN